MDYNQLGNRRTALIADLGAEELVPENDSV